MNQETETNSQSAGRKHIKDAKFCYHQMSMLGKQHEYKLSLHIYAYQPHNKKTKVSVQGNGMRK
jgi:hypothetical protein